MNFNPEPEGEWHMYAIRIPHRCDVCRVFMERGSRAYKKTTRCDGHLCPDCYDELTENGKTEPWTELERVEWVPPKIFEGDDE